LGIQDTRSKSKPREAVGYKMLRALASEALLPGACAAMGRLTLLPRHLGTTYNQMTAEPSAPLLLRRQRQRTKKKCNCLFALRKFCQCAADSAGPRQPEKQEGHPDYPIMS